MLQELIFKAVVKSTKTAKLLSENFMLYSSYVRYMIAYAIQKKSDVIRCLSQNVKYNKV